MRSYGPQYAEVLSRNSFRLSQLLVCLQNRFLLFIRLFSRFSFTSSSSATISARASYSTWYTRSSRKNRRKRPFGVYVHRPDVVPKLGDSQFRYPLSRLMFAISLHCCIFLYSASSTRSNETKESVL